MCFGVEFGSGFGLVFVLVEGSFRCAWMVVSGEFGLTLFWVFAALLAVWSWRWMWDVLLRVLWRASLFEVWEFVLGFVCLLWV